MTTDSVRAPRDRKQPPATGAGPSMIAVEHARTARPPSRVGTVPALTAMPLGRLSPRCGRLSRPTWGILRTPGKSRTRPGTRTVTRAKP